MFFFCCVDTFNFKSLLLIIDLLLNNEEKRPWIVPPLDEIDGAARILFPLFSNFQSCSKTRRHFFQLIS